MDVMEKAANITVCACKTMAQSLRGSSRNHKQAAQGQGTCIQCQGTCTQAGCTSLGRGATLATFTMLGAANALPHCLPSYWEGWCTAGQHVFRLISYGFIYPSLSSAGLP